MTASPFSSWITRVANGLNFSVMLVWKTPVNIPLNNQLQSHDLGSMNEPALAAARVTFETKWIRWNAIRTFFGILATGLLILVLFRL